MSIPIDAIRRSRGNRRGWVVRVWDAYHDLRRDEWGGSFPGVVYFIQAGPRGPIKIGYTEKPVERRLADLQTGNPRPLYLIGSCAGDRYLERKLHEWFAEWRLNGEWFRPSSFGLRELVDHVNARLPL